MKHAIVSAEMLESDIRPPGLRTRFRELALSEVETFFPANSLSRLAACPACESEDLEPAFDKYGYSYGRCRTCESVFARDRPTAEAMAAYYAESRAGKVRSEYLAGHPTTDVAEVLRARVDWVWTFTSGRLSGPVDLLDVGTSYAAILAELLDLGIFRNVLSVDPAPSIAPYLARSGVEVTSELVEAGVVTAFEQLEHQANPRSFIARVAAATRDGGMLFLTTRSISGFDLQVLWDRSPYIFFPEHLNLFSIEGLQICLEQNGFEILELSTPGHLDIEFVRQTLEDDPTLEVPRFVRYLLERRSEHARRELQVFLQKTQLSSHVRIVARRLTGARR